VTSRTRSTAATAARSAYDADVESAVLVPVKAFADAKGRLSSVLGPVERARLAEWSAGRVLAAADGMRVAVACDDDAVAEWAKGAGAEVVWCPGLGLDGAVARGLHHLADTGCAHAVVVHSDLPLASGLRSLVEHGAITLVPDAAHDGTNVLSLPVDCRFEPAYGRRSFSRHLECALATGLPVRVVHHPTLSLDLDVPRDLTHPLVQEVLPPWLPTNPANLSLTR
jgi:2-phospho-L-lactate guanylyltransferase